MANLEDYYLNREEPVRSCLLALRQIILDFHPNIGETLKYGMPCFSYNKHLLCYLGMQKKSEQPYILIVDGNKIEHPNLIAGDRKKMKILPVHPNKDLPLKEISEVLTRALDLKQQV